jgi:predicted transcriptional regulator
VATVIRGVANTGASPHRVRVWFGKSDRPLQVGLAEYPPCSYTSGMKTAVSIPDEVFEKVERFARRAKRSRSEVFSAALKEYIARHSPDEVTDAINQALEGIGDQNDEFVSAATRRILEKTEWS